MVDKVHFLHLNVNRSFVDCNSLKQLVSEFALDIISLNEPYVLDSRIGAPNGYLEIHLDVSKYRTAFWISNRIIFAEVMQNHDMVAMQMSINKKEVLVITSYFQILPMLPTWIQF